MSAFNMDAISDSICFNADGWGPVNGDPLSILNDVPYAHFDKKERIGRPADFTQNSYHQQRYQKFRYGDQNSEFVYKHDTVEDSSFQLVDTVKAKSKGGQGQFKRMNMNQRQNQIRQQGIRGGQGGRGQGPQMAFGNRHNQRGGGGRGGQQGRFQRRPEKRQERLPSLSVGPDWLMIAEFDHSQLLKMQTNPPKVQDLVWCGHLDQYDENFDKITTRSARALRRIDNRIFYSVTTQEDPVLQKYSDLTGEGGQVFATDTILAQMMAAPRAVYSWDLVIEKKGKTIHIDKRDNSSFDYLTVSETSRDPPSTGEGVEELNYPDKLSLEATMINQNFSQQVLLDPMVDEVRKIYEPNPFYDADENTEEVEPASVAYRYRQFSLGGLSMVVRTELHSWLNKRGSDQFLNIYSLNEWDSRFSGGIVWKQKIDQQRGAVLATELKNNSCKLAKWTAQCILSGADHMKLGYVSRAVNTNQYEHQILATQFFKPRDLAAQINLNVNNMWGIVKMICDLVLTKEDGKFVLMKDPNKATLRLYSLPEGALDVEEEAEGEEGDEKEGEKEEA